MRFITKVTKALLLFRLLVAYLHVCFLYQKTKARKVHPAFSLVIDLNRFSKFFY
jgi:hypothetical protein